MTIAKKRFIVFAYKLFVLYDWVPKLSIIINLILKTS